MCRGFYHQLPPTDRPTDRPQPSNVVLEKYVRARHKHSQSIRTEEKICIEYARWRLHIFHNVWSAIRNAQTTITMYSFDLGFTVRLELFAVYGPKLLH